VPSAPRAPTRTHPAPPARHGPAFRTLRNLPCRPSPGTPQVSRFQLEIRLSTDAHDWKSGVGGPPEEQHTRRGRREGLSPASAGWRSLPASPTWTNPPPLLWSMPFSQGLCPTWTPPHRHHSPSASAGGRVAHRPFPRRAAALPPRLLLNRIFFPAFEIACRKEPFLPPILPASSSAPRAGAGVPFAGPPTLVTFFRAEPPMLCSKVLCEWILVGLKIVGL